jgi:serine/threonine protein kinase
MAGKNTQLLEKIKIVGEGSFGIVYLGTYRGESEVAIKEIKGHLSAEAREEANILKRLRHRNIIRYIDIIQERDVTCLVMEYIAAGSLYQYIHRMAQSSAYWKATRQMMVDVAHAMSYLHSERIVHADLKSLNVLIRHDYEAVICDFGLARTMVDSKTVNTCNSVGTLVTDNYLCIV